MPGIHVTLSEDAMPQSPTVMITQSGSGDVWVNLLGVPTTSGPAVVQMLRDIAQGLEQMEEQGLLTPNGVALEPHLDGENSPRKIAEDLQDTAHTSAIPARPKFAPH